MQRFYTEDNGSIMSLGCNNMVITRSANCEAGSAITLSTYTASPEQQWEIQGDHIMAMGDGCDYVLDIFGAQTAVGATIILYFQNGQTNQDWEIVG